MYLDTLCAPEPVLPPSILQMNSGSSRSHAMLQVLVTQVQRDTLTTRRSKLSESPNPKFT